MFNLASILIGLLGLVIVIPAQIPLLGWANWIALPFIVLGIGLGALSSKDSGMKFCIVIFVVAVVRLSMGGGIV